jgi:hypothetical protein
MENTEPLIVASKEIGLKLNADKSKCMVMSGDQTAGQSDGMNIGSVSFERVE